MSATPKILKLMRVLDRAQSDLARMEPKPYGGSNPYYYCSKCNRSMIEASYAGHYTGCKYQNQLNKINSLKVMVNIELENFLVNQTYDSQSFKNYLWFKKDVGVSQLYKLEEKIKSYQKDGIVPSID